MTDKNILKYTAIIIVVFLLAGLAAWYFFLNERGKAITSSDSARGLGSDSPSFSGRIGSTYSNIISGVASRGEEADTASSTSKIPPQLWQVTKAPVAGIGFIGNGSTTKLYFAERSTGYILSADPKTGAVERVTNKLFPRTYEAVFGANNSVVLRSTDEDGNITSFAGSFTASTSALTGNYLGRNIRTIAPDYKTRGLLYMVKNDSGEGIAVRSSWSGAKPQIIFTSHLSGWKPVSLENGRAFFTLMPADNVPGFAYELKSDGALVPKVQDALGLTFLPNPYSSGILYGESSGGSLSLFVRAQDGAAPFSLSIRTVADKCVWSSLEKNPVAYCAVPQFIASYTFLNDWYRGAIHTRDSWWRVNADGTVEQVFSPSEKDGSLDVENPAIDANGEYIAFVNAEDKTPWLLRMPK